MYVRFLGKSTRAENSPTLYVTHRHSYIVQGWRVAGHDEGVVEIPHPLLAFLEPGTCLSTRLDDTGNGTFLVSGTPVTDSDLLSMLAVPDHEQCVEVPMGAEIRPDDKPFAADGAT